MPSELTMTTEEKTLITAEPMTEAGNPATVDGAVVFSVTSGNCTVQAVDALSAYVVSGPAPGDSQIAVQADADLGAGVVHISDTVLVHVTSATAESLSLTIAEPELK